MSTTAKPQKAVTRPKATTSRKPMIPPELLSEIRAVLAPYGWDVVADGAFLPHLGQRSPLFIRYGWGRWQVIHPLRRKQVLFSTPAVQEIPKFLLHLHLKSKVFMG